MLPLFNAKSNSQSANAKAMSDKLATGNIGNGNIFTPATFFSGLLERRGK